MLNFVHDHLVSMLYLPSLSCSPIKVSLTDGHILRHATCYITQKISIASVLQVHTFIVALIGIHCLILSMPWLESVNPDIDWECKSVKYRKWFNLILTSRSGPYSNSHFSSYPSSVTQTSTTMNLSQDEMTVAPPTQATPTPPLVRLMCRIDSSDEVYIQYLSSLADSLEPEIPEEYHDITEVSSKKKAEELPPHRGQLDHHIPLEKDAKPVFGPIYNLSETELQVLKDYIKNNLRKGFIHRSTSPFGSPVYSSEKLMEVYASVLTITP